jgi:hypothetical protein
MHLNTLKKIVASLPDLLRKYNDYSPEEIQQFLNEATVHDVMVADTLLYTVRAGEVAFQFNKDGEFLRPSERRLGKPV